MKKNPTSKITGSSQQKSNVDFSNLSLKPKNNYDYQTNLKQIKHLLWDFTEKFSVILNYGTGDATVMKSRSEIYEKLVNFIQDWIRGFSHTQFTDKQRRDCDNLTSNMRHDLGDILGRLKIFLSSEPSTDMTPEQKVTRQDFMKMTPEQQVIRVIGFVLENFYNKDPKHQQSIVRNSKKDLSNLKSLIKDNKLKILHRSNQDEQEEVTEQKGTQELKLLQPKDKSNDTFPKFTKNKGKNKRAQQPINATSSSSNNAQADRPDNTQVSDVDNLKNIIYNNMHLT